MELVWEKQKASTKALLKPEMAFFHFGWAEKLGGKRKEKKRTEKERKKNERKKREKREKFG